MTALQRNALAFAEHTAALRGGSSEPEPHVHQTRVATRRLRAALRLFGKLLPQDAGGLRVELQWIANQFAPVRDLDVQLQRLRGNALALDSCAPLRPYRAWLVAERGRAMQSLCVALDSPRFGALLAHLEAASDWQVEAGDLDPGKPIKDAVGPLKKAVANVHEPPAPAELHRVRIRAKRARYTVEFFEDLYPRSATRLRERLVAVQELLGSFQDSVVSLHYIDTAVAVAGGAWPTHTLLALGRLQQHERQFETFAKQEFAPTYTAVEDAWKRLDVSKYTLA